MDLVPKKSVNKKRKRTIVGSSIFAGIFIIFLLGVILTNSSFSGQVVLTENDTLEFTESTSYVFVPTEKGEIRSIKITGKLVGDGDAQVYFQDNLIFTSVENSSTSLITGNVINEGSNETNSTEVNETETNSTETNSTEVNETETNSTETNSTEVTETETNETETNSTELNETETNSTEVNETETNETETNSTEVNETEVTETEDFDEGDTETSSEDDSSSSEEEEVSSETEEEESNEEIVEEEVVQEEVVQEEVFVEEPVEQEEEVIEEPVVYIDETIQNIFVDECKDTCRLEEVEISDEYTLEIFLEGNVKLIIYEIEYEIVPAKEEVNETNSLE
jgi:flagellin-like hook-associated protein FlgL